MTRVAIYCRISRDDGGAALGVARQEEDCRARAEREGWEIIQVFVDNDLSASEKATKPRPRWDALLAAAERMEFEVLLGYSNNRFSRDMEEREELIKLNKRTGVRVCTIIDGDENFATSDGRMVARMRAAVDAAYSERITENVRRAARQRGEQGRPHGGQRPFGWGVDTGRTYFRKGVERTIYDTALPREPEFSALTQAIRDVTEGKSLRWVAKSWDADPLLAPTGGAKSWTASLTSLRNVLTRWRNAGFRVYDGQPLFDAPLACTPAVTREELEALHDHLSDRARRHNRGRVAQTALLSGLATCGACGSPIRSATHELGRHVKGESGPRVGTYRCVRGCVTIRRVHLDELVINAVIVELMSTDLSVHAESAADRAQLRWLRAQKEALEAESTQLGLDRGNGEITRSQFIAINAGLQRRVEAAELAWKEVQSRFVLADWVKRERELLDLSDEDRDKATASELARFEALPLYRRREIVVKLLEITVNKGRSDERVVITARASGTQVIHGWSDTVSFIPGPPPPSAEPDEN